MKSILLALVAALQLTSASGAGEPSRRANSLIGLDTTSIERLVPVDWGVTQSIQGDLNGDSIPDLAVVLLRDDADEILTRDDRAGKPSKRVRDYVAAP